MDVEKIIIAVLGFIYFFSLLFFGADFNNPTSIFMFVVVCCSLLIMFFPSSKIRTFVNIFISSSIILIALFSLIYLLVISFFRKYGVNPVNIGMIIIYISAYISIGWKIYKIYKKYA